MAKEDKPIKAVTWRVADHVENEKLTHWLSKQQNYKNSIADVVLYMIDRFGYRDVTEHEVRKELMQEPLKIELEQLFGGIQVSAALPTVSTADPVDTVQPSVVALQSENEPAEIEEPKQPSSGNGDIYNSLNDSNF